MSEYNYKRDDLYPYTQNSPGIQQQGWTYYNGQWHPVPGGAPAQQPQDAQPPKKKKSRAGFVAGMLVACTMFGFFGGAAAHFAFGGGSGGQTVVYKATPGIGTSVSSGDGVSVSDIAEVAGQSVVSITTENVVTNRMFGNQVMSGAGSGVIISEDGTILTNHHVVDGANNVVVTLPDGSEHTAVLVGSDAANDIAVLKINVTGLTPAVLGNSDELRVGEFCLAIGNPLGHLGGTVTDGIISALDRAVEVEGRTMNLLQMSAAVSPGNSGGGLFNGKGELIGIVNAKSAGEDVEGLGFAIPINTAMQIAEELIENGQLTGRPGLGVVVQTIANEEEARAAGVDAPGLYILQVNRGGAAEKAGLLVGDRILSMDGQAMDAAEDLSAALAQKQVGDDVKLVILRDGEEMTITVRLGELLTAA